MLVRRMATVTICAPLASTARRVSSKSLYLPVPRSRREAYALPAIFRESIGCLYSVSDAHARVAGDGKIDRVGDEAMLVRLVVQPLGGAGPGQLGAEMMDLRHAQPPPTATTISSRSPLASAVCAKRLRGTISPFRSTATRLPASCRRSSSAAMSVSGSKRWAAPLTLTSITFWTYVSGRIQRRSGCTASHTLVLRRLAFCHGTASETILILRQFELSVIIGYIERMERQAAVRKPVLRQAAGERLLRSASMSTAARAKMAPA